MVATNQNRFYISQFPLPDNGIIFQAVFSDSSEKITDIALLEDANSLELLILTDSHQLYRNKFDRNQNLNHFMQSNSSLPGLTEREKKDAKSTFINVAVTLEKSDAAGYAECTINLSKRIVRLKEKCFFNNKLNQLINEILLKLKAKVLQKVQAEQGSITDINKLTEFKALNSLETLLGELCETEYYHPTKEDKFRAIKQYQKEVVGVYWFGLSPKLRTAIMTFVGALVGFVAGVLIGGFTPAALITGPLTAGLFAGGITHFTSKRSKEEVLALNMIEEVKSQLVVA
ncbi:MAG: hypothetical protein GY821_10160 [Gammaproteobacteria bacterium]|nr:hypothetical protein [Gammaproteobacteria bacterium]